MKTKEKKAVKKTKSAKDGSASGGKAKSIKKPVKKPANKTEKKAGVQPVKKVPKPEVKTPLKAPETLEEAIEQAKGNSTSKFDASIDAHITTKSKEKEYSLRGTVTYPNPFGAAKRVIVFCEDKDKEKALKAGADFAGITELSKKVNEGWFEFDVVLATPPAMGQIAMLGKVLGPKGLMPNPKSGTVITDFDAIAGFKGGKTTFKGDGAGVVHCRIGKVSMETKALAENAKALVDAVREACNKSKANVQVIYLAPTMGASVSISKELV